ncbi:SDR family NAD(P)-dependent oxidoreductase [Streptomyces syringium]|uniref:SDR family NAD(P)-dependent oxidoreductase n=1 Tax=Streptomyces syringium TaxID=76729 RepID=UPI00343055F2
MRPAMPTSHAVAVIGIACRLPGGITTPDDLWEALSEGRDLIGEVPADRFDAAAFLDPDPTRPGRSYTFAGGFLKDIAGFDADFFGISPREASRMDPQQRLLLEMAVEALEDAGIPADAVADTDTGVYIGVSGQAYGELQQCDPPSTNAYTMAGRATGNAANRLSHALDLRGPSMAVDTACSSSLVATHQACQAIREGTSRLALAGGVNLLLSPHLYIGFSKASMLSPTGRCRTFSAAADGYVRAEGGGLLVLKRLSHALRDGDRVHGVILASGVNADGRTSGLSLPSPGAQEALLREVYERAGVDAEELVYLEAHGTGTAAGDPIECEAIGRALGRHRPADSPLPIGSVKTNLGHLEPASGTAGLYKALLVLRERVIPPSLHGTPTNPAIDFDRWHLTPVAQALPVTAAGRAVVGVNSFGFGGANAHVVLAEPPPRPPAPPTPSRSLPVMVTARTPAALTEGIERMSTFLRNSSPDSFADIAYTSCRRRTLHEYRAVVLATGQEEASRSLAALARTEPADAAVTGRAVPCGKTVFAFSGNGSVWAGMGADLLLGDHVFREAVEECDSALTGLLGWSVLRELAGPPRPERLERTEIAQPLLFTVQIALVALLRHRGIVPAAVLGHSVGEVAAARTAGALDLPAAARVIAARSHAQASTAGQGRMAAAGLPAERAAEELAAYEGRLEIAAINSDRDITVSGDAEALRAWGESLASRQIPFTHLPLGYAFHSNSMDLLEKPLTTALDTLATTAPVLPMASTVTGRIVGHEDTLDGRYWWHNIRRPVLFGQAARTLQEEGHDIFVEIGPHPVLTGYLRRMPPTGTRMTVAVPTLARHADGQVAMDNAVCQLLAAGADQDWAAHFPTPGNVVDLPAYPWQREPHWNGSPDWWAGTRGNGRIEHPLLGARCPAVDPSWESTLEPAHVPWLADHKVGRSTVLPATAYVEMALAAGRRALGAAVELGDLDISHALVLPDPATDARLHTSVCDEDGIVRIASTTADSTREHARGRVRRLLAPPPPALGLTALHARMPGRIARTELYARATRAGLCYGPAFQILEEAAIGKEEVLAAYRHHQPDSAYETHPALLDGALQAGIALLPTEEGAGPYLPAAIETLRVWRTPTDRGFFHVRARAVGDREACWDVIVTDETGQVCVDIRGVWLRRFDAAEGAKTVGRYTTVLRAAPHRHSLPAPGLLPRTDEVLRAAAPALGRVQANWQDYPFAACSAALKEVSAHFIAATMRMLLPRVGDFSATDLLKAGVLPRYGKLLDVLLGLAADYGLFERRDGPARYRPVLRPEPEGAVAAFAQAHPDQAAMLALYSKCGSRLSDALTGRCAPTEMLFDEDRHLVEQVYDQWHAVRLGNELVGALVTTFARMWPADRALRILEVGAGAGSLAVKLLPYLPPERTAYTFTDISASFFPRARHRLAGHDFIHYRPLDLDEVPEEQGFSEAGYDMVVATNVLHATSDLSRTLRHLSRLLADEGVLIAAEVSDTQALAPCFGLLEGFWKFTDHQSRTSSPLLSAPQWVELVGSGEYQDVLAVGRAGAVTTSEDGVAVLARRKPRDAAPAVLLPPAVDPAQAHTWIVAAGLDDSDMAEALTTELDALGHADVRVVAPTDASEQWADFLPRSGRADVVLVLGERSRPSEVPWEQALVDQAVDHAAVLRAIAVACERVTSDVTCVLWLIARPSGALPDDMAATRAPVDAAAWGTARTLASEQGRLTVKRVAFDRGGDVRHAARWLCQELLSDSSEDEVVLTPGGRFVPRVIHQPHPEATYEGSPSYSLRVSGPGSAYRLAWEENPLPVPAANEVVIEVRASSLNYHDVMVAAGLLPVGADGEETRPALGMDCAGIVTTVGKGVSAFTPGDRVYGLAFGSLSSHAVVDADFVARVPPGMTFAEAATLPGVFLTVHYSLDRLARVTRGETVLVHAGAGGVGLAVLQYVRSCGARVIATAGSPTKRALLRQLGAEHVLNSRDLSFADRIKDLTDGRGVDVVVNSLAGEAIARGMELLRPYGRFIELGKRDIYAGHRLLLRPFRKNLSYFAVDIHHMFLKNRSLAREVFAQMAERVQGGVYRPLLHQPYRAHRVHEAFRCLHRAEHIGKVVVELDERPAVVPAPTPLVPDPEATYLITGGLSGFGAATARWLAARGARHLALLGRRGPATPGAGELVQALAAAGATATVHAVDVTDAEAVRRVLDGIDLGGRRVGGVVHAAMVLDDRPLRSLDDDRFRAVLAPKAQGALVLDSLTRGRRPDFFIVYSSMAAVVGSAGQAPYVAGNLFLEALIRDRRRHGLPGLAIAWGALADVGYVARNNLTEAMERVGLGQLRLESALGALDNLIGQNVDIAAVGTVHWGTLERHLPSQGRSRFSALLPSADEPAGRDGAELRKRFVTADREDAEQIVAQQLVRLLAAILQTTPERIDTTRGLDLMGMDSLMGIEFAETIRRRLGCDLPVIEVVSSQSITDLARRVTRRLKPIGNNGKPTVDPAESSDLVRGSDE